MGLQKEDLSIKMVEELDLTCTPSVYLEETEKLHRQLFPDVCFLLSIRKLISHSFAKAQNLIVVQQKP